MTRARRRLIVALAATAAVLAASVPVLTASATTPTAGHVEAKPSCRPKPRCVPTPTWTPSPTTPPPTATATPTATTGPPTPGPTTTTPTPTAAPTGCVADPGRCGYPDAASTGPSGTLVPVVGTVQLSTPGMTYQDRAVAGCIEVKAPDVTIKNVSVRCLSGGYAIDYYVADPAAPGTLTIEDVSVDCGNRLATAIGEMRLVVRRVEVTGCEHGFDLDYRATLTDVWCHDLADQVMFPDGHTDCVIGQMYYDVTISHSTLLPGAITTSAVEGDCGTCGSIVRTGWSVTNNLMSGGAYTLYCTHRSTEVGSVVSGNRFGTGAYGYATSCDAGVAWSGNVDDATGAALEAA